MKVTLVRSRIGVPKVQRATLKGLGLSKIGDSRELADTPDVKGMVDKVSYLLRIEGQGK